MKIIILIVLCLINFSAFGIEVTQEQFENIGLLCAKLQETNPNLKGFNGSKTNLNVLGNVDPVAIKTEMDTLDIETLKKDDPKRKDIKKLRNKFKSMGLDDEDLALLGLTNDIPDA